MVKIRIETRIIAPIESCFDLARSLSGHVSTTGRTRETIVSRHDHDLLELGDMVTFEANHLGVRQRLTSKIVGFDRPSSFADQMIEGAFRSLRHLHQFESEANGNTKMIDTVEFEAPFGPFGWLFERLFLRRYMEQFLRRRGLALKDLAERNRC